MKDKRPVSIRTQTILAFIPYLNLVAFYDIQKFWIGLGVVVGIHLVSGFIITPIMPFPYEILAIYGVYLSVVIPLIRKWSKEWNKQFPNN